MIFGFPEIKIFYAALIEPGYFPLDNLDSVLVFKPEITRVIIGLSIRTQSVSFLANSLFFFVIETTSDIFTVNNDFKNLKL